MHTTEKSKPKLFFLHVSRRSEVLDTHPPEWMRCPWLVSVTQFHTKMSKANSLSNQASLHLEIIFLIVSQILIPVTWHCYLVKRIKACGNNKYPNAVYCKKKYCKELMWVKSLSHETVLTGFWTDNYVIHWLLLNIESILTITKCSHL